MSPSLTVRDLRRLWKPHKERLANSPANIRFHRACSWLQRTEQTEEGSDLDFALLGRWFAFNALYGQWDECEKEPVPDRICWQVFLERMLALDAEGRMATVLTEHKRLVLSILDDQYLSRYFWEDPCDQRARRSRKTMFDARSWYVEGRWLSILERVVERVYFLRCQLVHGASTYGSSLNRTALRRCSAILDHLLTAILLVWIDHGSGEDWGIMCYPPMRPATASDERPLAAPLGASQPASESSRPDSTPTLWSAARKGVSSSS